MISPAPYTKGDIPHPTFTPDNQKLADLLTVKVKDTNARTRTKGSAHVQNGWHIFTNLKTHYLRTSNTEKLSMNQNLCYVVHFILVKSAILLSIIISKYIRILTPCWRTSLLLSNLGLISGTK